MAGRNNSERKLHERFRDFISNHPPLDVSRHLRNMLLDYIQYHSANGLPVDFNRYLAEMYDLFELLDIAADLKKEQV